MEKEIVEGEKISRGQISSDVSGAACKRVVAVGCCRGAPRDGLLPRTHQLRRYTTVHRTTLLGQNLGSKLQIPI
ncbi:unnamed protein product [Urochloa humidicola]